MSFDDIIQTEDSVQKKKDPRDVGLKHLAHRDRTSQEMKKHLKEKGYTADEIEMTMSYLLDMNYVNDEVYIQKYIEYAVSKGKGILKIRSELVQKGIAKELINDTLSCCETLAPQSERKRALAQALKIVGDIKIDISSDCDDDFNSKAQKYKELQRIKAKVARRLESLGYSRDVIFTTVEEMFSSNYQ